MSTHFSITDHVEFDSRGRAQCPSCLLDGKTSKNLALVPGTDGAYKCHRGCTSGQIREALGYLPDRAVPPPNRPPAKIVPAQATTFPLNTIEADMAQLQGVGAIAQQARDWLNARGIDQDLQRRFRLGLRRRRDPDGPGMVYAITIPFAVDADGSRWYRKERIAPWDSNYNGPKWSQYGVPPQIWFSHKPANARETWLLAGEWDAMLLGGCAWLALIDDVAIATATCGEGAVPHQEQIDRLPGRVRIIYDLDAAGEKGAAKMAAALGDRATIVRCPGPANAHDGWDVSDYLLAGGDWEGLAQAEAIDPVELGRSAQPTVDHPVNHPPAKPSLADRLVWNQDLIAKAPDTIDYVVPGLLTSNELFLLAASPRAGKSLLCLSLAHAVATGGKFLGRPCTQGTVLYVNLEDGDSKIKLRQEMQGWNTAAPVAWLDDFKLSELNQLGQVVEQLNPVLVVIDTLSRVRDGSVSESSAEMSQVMEPLQKMARAQNCAIVVVHHARKVSADQAGDFDPFDLVRGSSAIRATARGCWMLCVDKETPGCHRLIVEHGFGREDLKLHLDLNTLSWTALGKWNVTSNQSQADQILDYLETVEAATCSQIAKMTGIPERSCQTTLWRLQADEMLTKTGGRKGSPALFSRGKLVNVLTNNCGIVDENSPCPVSVSGYSSTKNTNFSPTGLTQR